MVVAHSVDLLSKCAQFREEDEFIDVRLKVGEDVFPAHRIVLAANSDYFHAMFTDGMKESNQEMIELKDENISPDALKIVMDSIYTGDLNVNEENVFEVLAAADHLQVTNVVQQCCDFLKREFIQLRLDLHNYFLLCTVADRYSLKDLEEEAEHKMALSYAEICESEEFLSEINAEQLIRFLSRDDLSAPSETFVFKSVMQWIKHKEEERMAVAAKVVGAVRLGLVDIRVMIEELNTDEMLQVPEIHEILFDAFIYLHAPSHLSKFAEKARPRVTGSVLIAIKPNSQVHYFDFLIKNWKPLPSMARLPGTGDCVCTAHVGNQLYLATNDTNGSTVYCYNIDRNSWERLSYLTGSIGNLCITGDYMYAINSDHKQIPQRYSFVNRQWQSVAKIDLSSHPLSERDRELREFGLHKCCFSGAEVLRSKLYVIYGCMYTKSIFRQCLSAQYPVLRCFSPAQNKWEDKGSVRLGPHFGSSLFIVNDRLCIAGGKCSVDGNGIPKDETASVQVYDEVKNTWSVVEQKHIPTNNLGAVEIERRVYFIINKFPVDSGIRIPPGEVYPVSLGEWENLSKVGKDTVLCYLPVKRGLQG